LSGCESRKGREPGKKTDLGGKKNNQKGLLKKVEGERGPRKKFGMGGRTCD